MSQVRLGIEKVSKVGYRYIYVCMCVCVSVSVSVSVWVWVCVTSCVLASRPFLFFFSMTVNRRNGARFSYTPCLNLPKTENWDGFLMRDKSV